MGFVYSKAVVLGLLSGRPIDPRYPDHRGLNISICKHAHRETSMFQAHLMEVAATGIFQVAEMELKHLLLQLTELDSRLFDKSFVDLLYLFCNGNGAKQKKKKKKNSLDIMVQFLILCTPPPSTRKAPNFGRSFPGSPGGKGKCLDKVGFSQEGKAYLNGARSYEGPMSSTLFHFCLVENQFFLLLEIKEK